MKQFVLVLKAILISTFCISISISAHASPESESYDDLLSGNDSFQSSNLMYEEPEFLPVDEAFTWDFEQKGQSVIIRWHIVDGYYLYRERFNFTLVEAPSNIKLGKPVFENEGKMKDDPAFGMVEVYYKTIAVKLPLLVNGPWNKPLTMKIGYQGCADAGLCYQPQSREIELLPQASTQIDNPDNSTFNSQNSTFDNPASGDTNEISGLIKSSSLWISLGTLFLLGVGLAFTPCVLPMVPILSSIIVGQENISTRKAFLLSITYVLGMAITYSIAGVLVGYFGAKANLQMYLQEPAVLISFAAVFIILSLSMFGFYELQLPAFVRDRLDQINQEQKGGHYVSVAFMGVLSALVVSPCVSAPLIGVLTYISSTGDAFLGGISLFALSLGMGLPLILIGLGGGKFLPSAGEWMNTIKAVFGVLLLAVAVWLLERILPGPVTLVLWAALLIPSGIFMGAFEKSEKGWPRLWKGIGIIFIVYGVLLMIGAATGESDPLRPLHSPGNKSVKLTDSPNQTAATNHKSHLAFEDVNTLVELNQALDQAKLENKTVMLDFYADWCISCKVFERVTFSDPEVQSALNNTTLLQADLSDLTSEHQAMLDKFGLFGLPSILFFNPQGEEIQAARVQGEMNAKQFLSHLQNNVLSQQTNESL